MKQLSILLPSGPNNQAKLARTLKNLRETISDISQVEVVICLDANGSFPDGWIERIGDSIIQVYEKPSKYRGRFFNAAWKASTGRFLLMANDDMLFKTKGWDKLIPYDKYPDDLVCFGFRDNTFNERFYCHPVWSRKAMELGDDLFSPNYWITKCDNTIFDIHPAHRRVYLPEIEIDHRQTPYGPEWQPAYDYDNNLYMDNAQVRNKAYQLICKELKLDNNKVMIGVATAEFARRADFYDHLNMLQRPPNSMNLSVHGQSIAYARNQIVEQALVHGATHVMFIDDDVIVKPDALFRLLAHDKDVVCGLQLTRNYPHLPLVDFGYRRFLKPSDRGLVKILSAGLGICLIKTEVFKAMLKPWFRFGVIRPDHMDEDTSFFQHLDADGFEVYLDTDCRVGHIASMAIWPDKIGEQWVSTYDTQGHGSASVPQLELGEIQHGQSV